MQKGLQQVIQMMGSTGDAIKVIMMDGDRSVAH